jgi:hypothetical protein
MGGMMYANGGGIDNPGFKALPIEVQNNIKNNMAMGGKYVTAGNEYHKVYRNADGDIMVNHPKEDKGKWDTINLTEKSNANTIAEGVKSVKDWHKNNPYAYGGMIYAMGGENNTWKEGPVSQRDSVANMARNTMIWEANRGSGAGTGLSNFGNSALSPGASIDESVDWYMQNIYPKLEAYPTAMEKASAGDFLYNTGKNLLNYTDWDNRKNDTAALASWEEKLKTLTPNERRIALNNARDRYYKNTAPAGSTWDLKTQGPHPAYWNTWYGRQHATDQYTPLTDQDVTNRANKKFYPVQKAMGGEIENAIAPAFFSHGGGIHIDPSKKGTFTAAATKHGKSVQGFASQVLANKENYSPAMVKKANFAKNASKWKHAYGGPMGMYFNGPGDKYNGIPPFAELMPDIEQPNNNYNGIPYATPAGPREEEQFEQEQQPTQPTKPTLLNKPFVKYPQQELTIPNLSYKPNTGNSPFYNKNYKSLLGTGTNMNNSKESEEPKKPKQKFDAGDLAYLGNLASPLIQLFGTKKQPYDYQRVSPELVKYNPNTTADLVRRGSSLPMYSIKQLGLSPANYLNMISSISGKAGENIGQANLEGQMKEQIANAGIKNETNRYNAEVQRLQQEAAAKEYAGRLKSYVTGAQGLSNALSQYVLDKRAGKESEENKQLMKDYTDKHFSYLDKQLEAMKPKSIYNYNSSSTLPSSTLPVSPTFKRNIPTNLELNLPKSKYGLF